MRWKPKWESFKECATWQNPILSHMRSLFLYICWLIGINPYCFNLSWNPLFKVAIFLKKIQELKTILTPWKMIFDISSNFYKGIANGNINSRFHLSNRLLSLSLSLSPQKYPLYGLLKQIMVVVGFGINSFVCELIMASKICC